MLYAIDNVSRILPADIKNAFLNLSEDMLKTTEEVRLRSGQEPTVVSSGAEWPFFAGRIITESDIDITLQRATESSLHSAQDELRQGFVTTKGGVRVGVCGTVTHDGGISGIKNVSSLAVRVARQIPGAGAEAVSELSGGEASVLILSPPGGGKTTFLRELVRAVSKSGKRVSLADERGEVAAFFDGKPGFDVGRTTDVLTGAPKAQGAMMLLRGMNPQIIALDEITAAGDLTAVETASNCGVKIFATAHASDVTDLQKRPLYRRLLELGAFEKAVVISQSAGERQYKVVEL